ncbi:GAF domain-containing protein [Salinimicrobium sp. TH3]|uniref:GAF domain-containing protein n=1 Tax=Salinimicrobium sp. TH3 TaxID=2997342 RepID=UPI00227557EA|nr:GAF domain-containing protein [Salinimicrobium sp. TH3]MCY2686918.1 GAF domain-containing protein [Salinimicrobium sp. TH3]
MKNQKEFPLEIKISFHKIIEQYRKQLENESSMISKDYLGKILDYISGFPVLEDGIENSEDLNKLKDPIRILMKDLFPEILSGTQIKAISVPFHNVIFNSTLKFREILAGAGKDFNLNMRDLSKDLDYIYACILILNKYYGYDMDFSRPLYYDIPDENGILRHYRIELDSQFMELEPGKNACEITKEDVDELIQNIENVEFWKQKFPPKSWIFKGFTIITLTDVTVDDAISDLKTTLLQRNTSGNEEMEKFEEIFKSIYKIPNLRVGFTMYNEQESTFERMMGNRSPSFLLREKKTVDCREALEEEAYQKLVKEHNYFSIPNVTKFSTKSSENLLAKSLVDAGVKSAILAPIAKNGILLGMLELVSFEKNVLNSINATKLEDILPYIVTAVERSKAEFENRVKAVIQSECTSIHPSVLWIFEKEARKFIRDLDEDGLASFKDITFEDVYPLYGEIDIVASSEARNEAIQKDLLDQLELITNIVCQAEEIEKLDIYEQVKFRIKEFQDDLANSLSTSSEQKVFNLLQREIDPVMAHIEKQTPVLEEKVSGYRKNVNSETGIIYNHRKNYDEAVQQINRTMARYIDRRQIDAQEIYPHYFERYKTDGVEHNIYIGTSLTNKKAKPFDEVYLYNLRLWQLSTMCEMENRFYQIQENMPLKLEAASLILVYNTTLSIRYRMDEKQFDVDGTYNARYEIIKKRIDKAHVKGTEERVTQKGKIAIVYSNRKDEREYLRYIKYLQSKQYLGDKVEKLELEDVQGVIGLKAIRVEVLYHLKNEQQEEQVFTYEDLEKVLGQVISGNKTENRENDSYHKDSIGNP